MLLKPYKYFQPPTMAMIGAVLNFPKHPIGSRKLFKTKTSGMKRLYMAFTSSGSSTLLPALSVQ